MKISPICWVCLRKHIPYQEIKLSKATQGLPALEARLNFLARRLYSRSWKMVGWLFWGDNQRNKGPALESQACCPISPQRDGEKGLGGLAGPAVLPLAPAPAWGQHVLLAFQEGCKEAAVAVPSSLLCFAYNQLGNAETLLCWCMIAERCSHSSQRIRAVRKSCQGAANPYNYYFFFKLQHVILNCSMLSSPCESCTTTLPLCSCACHSLDGEVSLAGLGTSLGCFTLGFRERFPCRTCVIWHNAPAACEAATCALGHLMASPNAPKTLGQAGPALPSQPASKPMGLAGGCSCWGLPTGGKWGGSALPCAVDLHVPLRSGLGCN